MLCCRGGDCEVAFERPGFQWYTPSSGGWGCSSATTESPAWQWSYWCSDVCVLRFSVDARPRLEVLGTALVWMFGVGAVMVFGSAACAVLSAFLPGRVLSWRRVV